ncbi:AER042Wp [Eremothecium gossypii ATCC 10895]|uniref:AER042Wp n=1 Tax=Eremothecium gossypii (strain ATCC 10895 / CBS 109.51 / FGSC 9923 / NRRL Y-1056) TaxID=284811 RepID=Q757H1_EREGS|nr:AER042Wp [Eremothecium gossypii ATCC 10895]AAS52726.1 AER042Wp [Eremothecium gossypii ATCC 10895]
MLQSVTDPVQRLLDCTKETGPSQLRSVLSDLYERAPRHGISPAKILELIGFLCSAEFIAVSTRVYIVENCLIPNGYLSSSTVFEVLKHLGPSTPQNAFKLIVEPAFQVALVKWLCHVLVIIPDYQKVLQRTYPIWFQLWMVDYLQDWTTYLLIWGTESKIQVTEYRVRVLERIGSNPGYRNGKPLASFLLHKFLQLKPSKIVQHAIAELRCNAKRLMTVQKVQLESKFMDGLQHVLSAGGVFESLQFKDSVNSQLNALKVLDDNNTNDTAQTPIGKQLTLEQFANQIERMPCPSGHLNSLDINGYERLLLPLMAPEAKEALHLWLEYLLRTEGNPTTLKRAMALLRAVDKTDIPFESLLLCDNFSSTDALKSLHMLYLVAEVPESNIIVNALLKSHKCLRSGKSPYAPQFILGLCILVMCKISQGELSKFLLQICSTFLKTLVNMCLLGKEAPKTALILIHPLLYTLENAPSSAIPRDELTSVFVLPDIINSLVALNDPLVIALICEYLVSAKDRVKGFTVDNSYVRKLNRCILDMANYLWRNKLFTEPYTWGLPKTFWAKISSNLYLPEPEIRQKHLYSLPNFYPFRFISEEVLRRLEGQENTEVIYSKPLTEAGYRCWRKELELNGKTWLSKVNNYDSFRKRLLMGIQEDSTYAGVPLFMQTYLKSFTESQAGS